MVFLCLYKCYIESKKMEEHEFWQKFREVVREEITAAMKTYFIPAAIPEEEIMIGTAELCEQLKLSKQTLYNWLNRPKTKPLIDANRQKVGNKVLYNITGIKAAIKKHPALFGGGRDYEFKSAAIISDVQKTERRFKQIDLKLLLNEQVSEADRNWYKAEKLRRENEVAARDAAYRLDD